MNAFLIVKKYDFEALKALPISELHQLDDRGRNLLYPLFAPEKVSVRMEYLAKEESIFDYLIEHGVSINHVDHLGNSIVMYCALKNHIDLFKKMMKLNPDLSIKNNDGHTVYDFIEEDALKYIDEMIGTVSETL